MNRSKSKIFICPFESKINKRGLSAIITTLLVVLLVLVAVGIVWVVIRNILKGGAEGIFLEKLTLDVGMKNVRINANANNVSLVVERESGQGEMTGVKFIFNNGTDTETIIQNIPIPELEERKFDLHLTKIDVLSLISISMIPLIKTGKQEDVEITEKAETFDVHTGETTSGGGSSGGGSSGGEIVVPICGNNVVESGEACDGEVGDETCISQGFDGGSLSCGLDCAFDTSGCSGACVPATCAGLGYECGSGYANGTCPGTLDCDAPGCGVGESCVGGSCVVHVSCDPNTYYIDFENGDDNNDGACTNTAWKHSPGMGTASGNAGAYNGKAGDRFVFKGGVTWQHTISDPMLPVYVTYDSGWEHGTETSPISFTIDLEWYRGTEWTKPVFDGNSLAERMFDIRYRDWYVIEGFEMKNHAVNGFGDGAVSLYLSDNTMVKDCYIHDWNPSVSIDHKYGGVVTNACTNTKVFNCHIKGPSSKYSGIGIYGNGIFKNNTIHNLPNGILGGGIISDSLIYDIRGSFDATMHENGVFIFGANNCDYSFYNNKLYNVEGGITLFLVGAWSNATNCSMKVYNNIMFNNVPIDITIDQRGATDSNPRNNYFIYNNYLQGNNNVVTTVTDSAPINNLSIKNNIMITKGTYVGVIDYPSNSQNIDVDYNIYYDELGSETVLDHPDSGFMSLTESQAIGINIDSIKLDSINGVFVDYLNNDFHLQPGSPAIDNGIDLSVYFTTDKDGVNRNDYAPWSIGAYEYVA